MTDELPVDGEALLAQVGDKYRTVAVEPDGTFHCHTGRPLAARLGCDPDLVIAGVVLLVVSNRKRPASS